MTAGAARSIAELATYLDRVEVVGDASCTISCIVDDSRAAAPGKLFVNTSDSAEVSARFLHDAYARKVGAVLVSEAVRAQLDLGTTALIVPDARLALARLAARTQGEPARAFRIVGITGTNGKTTTSFMIAALLADAQHKALRIGTLGAAWGDRELQLGYTTPPPLILHDLFAQAKADGVDAAVMEVSSHALALERVAELPIEMGVFTNLTRDHLDFHENVESYAAAKRKLFTLARCGIFNVDDTIGAAWYREFGGVSYAIDATADIRACDIQMSADASRFTVEGHAYALPMPGRFNIYNALAAIAVGRNFGLTHERMLHTFANFRGVPGRMERFVQDDCTVVVDYSHTPDALERVLTALRESAPANLSVVFGCGGDRDPGKRPQMGAIAERLADRVIVTSDNPRTEDPQVIADQIVAGMRHAAECVLDRKHAIESAVLEAPPQSIVLIAGKGAETEQRIGTQSLHFDDRREAERALALRAERRMERGHPV